MSVAKRKVVKKTAKPAKKKITNQKKSIGNEAKKRRFVTYEQTILRLLYQSRLPMTAYEIAKRLRMTPPTAKRYADGLVKLGLLKRLKGKKRTVSGVVVLYRFNFEGVRLS